MNQPAPELKLPNFDQLSTDLLSLATKHSVPIELLASHATSLKYAFSGQLLQTISSCPGRQHLDSQAQTAALCDTPSSDQTRPSENARDEGLSLPCQEQSQEAS